MTTTPTRDDNPVGLIASRQPRAGCARSGMEPTGAGSMTGLRSTGAGQGQVGQPEDRVKRCWTVPGETGRGRIWNSVGVWGEAGSGQRQQRESSLSQATKQSHPVPWAVLKG